MKAKLLSVVLIISLAFNLAVLFTVGFHWCKRGLYCKTGSGSASMHTLLMKKKLGLTQEQTDKLDKIFQYTSGIIDPLQESIHNKRTELFNTIRAGSPDSAVVEKLLGEISGLQMETEKATINNAIKTKEILTPEQRAKFDKLMERGFNKMHKRKRMMFCR